MKNLAYWKRMSVKQLQMKQKNQKGGFLGMTLGALAVILLWNLLAGKGVIPAG